MRNKISGIIFVLLYSISVNAQVSAPYSEVKGEIIISQFQSVDRPSTSDAIFLNALLWVINNREVREEEEEIPAINVDYDRKQLTLETLRTNPKTGSLYRFLMSVNVSDNIFKLSASSITYEAETTVIKLVKRLPFEKLQPEKKPKHKAYLDEFTMLFKEDYQRIIESISSNEPPVITHWAAIKEKSVVKGMTEAECLLSLGKPVSIQTQGAKTEWMYDAYTYLFFENGILASFIK